MNRQIPPERPLPDKQQILDRILAGSGPVETNAPIAVTINPEALPEPPHPSASSPRPSGTPST